jgi:hypothetical protein
MMVSRSWFACSRLTPGRSLPTTTSQFPLRSVVRQPPVPSGSSVIHISCRSPGAAPTKPFGATPITVTGW